MNSTYATYEIVILVWAVRAVGALMLLLGLLTAAIRLVRVIAQRTKTLGYLWRAAWVYARADHDQREGLRALARHRMPRVPGLREEQEDEVSG